jgi:hypothetical protein
MEEIGTYKVRPVQGELLIKAPDGCWGRYKLILNSDGSFTYYPHDGQVITSSKKGTQWIVTTPELEDAVTFTNEKAAVDYKEAMERSCGKVFRMKKVFPSNGIRTLGEPMC